VPINSLYGKYRIGQIYSRFIRKRIEVKKGVGQIVVKIKKIPLNSGKYTFNVWADYRGEILDWVLNAGIIQVDINDYYGSGVQPDSGDGDILFNYEFE